MTYKEGDRVDTARGEAVIIRADVSCGPGLIYLAEKPSGERFLIGQREIRPIPLETFV